MRYVGVGRRFLAVLIDGIIGSIWTYPFLDIQRSPGYFHAQLRGGGFATSFAITILYFTLMEGFLGATVGKFVTGIRVVKVDGSKLDFGAAFLRNILRVIDELPFFIPYLVGAILIWTSPTKQRLGDRVAKTVVVTASSVGAAPVAGAWTPPAGPIAPGGPPPIPPPPPMPGAPGPVPPPGLVPPPDVVPTPGPVRPADPEPSSTPDPVPPPETVRSPDPVPPPESTEPQPPSEG
jgi:uncharacterized RDD family membrane protein YckC